MLTLMKTMLGNTKVIGISANDPIKFTKSPMKGKAAATNKLKAKRNPLRKNLLLMFSLENMLSSSLRNFVSSVS